MYLSYYTKISRMSGKQSLLQKRKDTDAKTLEQLKQDLVYLEAAQAFIQQVAKDTQEQLRFMISDIVQLAIDTCFPGEYIFNVKFEIKRGKTEAVLCFEKHGMEVDPMSASGGGLVDIASFALRIAAWSLGRSNNTIVLDEPFRFLSKDLHAQAGEILKKLSKHLNLQIIMVTHNEEIITFADRVFTVTQNRKTGVSKVEANDN